MPELIRLLRTKSTMRYRPPKGTAGLARSLVNGYSRDPLPPARTKASTLTCMGPIVAHAGDRTGPSLWFRNPSTMRTGACIVCDPTSIGRHAGIGTLPSGLDQADRPVPNRHQSELAGA